MINFDLFGVHINTETCFLMFFFGLAGMFLGWFFKKFNPSMMILGIVVFAKIIAFVSLANHWVVTAPFVIGFLIHTYRPIMEKIGRI